MKDESEIETFHKLVIQLERMLHEVSELSKKHPNDVLNPFKLELVNRLLVTANAIVDRANKPFDEFETFDSDKVPTNSDVVMILSQYRVCLKKFFDENTGRNHTTQENSWIINGHPSKIKAPGNYAYLL